jgi:hypothetical protein
LNPVVDAGLIAGVDSFSYEDDNLQANLVQAVSGDGTSE